MSLASNQPKFCYFGAVTFVIIQTKKCVIVTTKSSSFVLLVHFIFGGTNFFSNKNCVIMIVTCYHVIFYQVFL